MTAVELDSHAAEPRIVGLTFRDGTHQMGNEPGIDYRYAFCPGEAIGTLQRLGFNEPAYAAFAGAALFITIPLEPEQIELYRHFSHCMEVHNVGICLAWQARLRENQIVIGVAGTKSFYGDKQPSKDEAFAKNRNLVQLT